MALVSKTTGDRLTTSGAVVAAIEVQGEEIAAKAQRALFEKKQSVDLAQLVQDIGKVLRHSEDELRQTDAAYLAELTDDEGVREAREAAHVELSDRVISARSMVVGAYGAAFAAGVGLGPQLERRADLLVAQARNAAKLLRKKRPAGAKVGNAKLVLTDIADAIDESAENLSSALSAVERERREAQTAMIARDKAAERWERVYGGVAEILVGLAFIAGEDELALRIRPTARKRAGASGVDTPVDAGDEVVEQPSEPAEIEEPA
jgi:hypothetical protein